MLNDFGLESCKQAQGGMQKLGFSGTAGNPTLFKHEYREINAWLLAILLKLY
jgi:hypothetical protein